MSSGGMVSSGAAMVLLGIPAWWRDLIWAPSAGSNAVRGRCVSSLSLNLALGMHAGQERERRKNPEGEGFAQVCICICMLWAWQAAKG